MPTVEVENLWKKFSLDARNPLHPRVLARRLFRGPDPHTEFLALKGVSCQVEPGEAFGIIGANGSGKSTLLKILCGILPATKGRAELHGSVSALIELGAGFHPDLTGRENVVLNAALLGFKKRDVLARMGDIHAFCELGYFLDQPVKRYSSGMYMRLGFAVAAHVEADILLIDEVLAVGDIGFQEKCLGRLAEQRARGATILFVSHDLNAVKGCCSRVMWLDHGVVREIGDAETVIAHYAESMLPSVKDLSRRLVPEIPPAEPIGNGDGLAPRETLTLTGVTLLDGAGEPAEQFRTGERMVIQIDYVAGRPVRDLMFAFGIEDLNNFICYGTSSLADGITMDIAPGPGRVRIIIEHLNLLTGTYKITAAARRADTNLEYDILLNAAFFQMRSGSAESGVFYLEHRWEVAPTAKEVMRDP
jgi:ABC-type polysaccharide/polyol phosphate transport system ATPase subunit